MKNEQDLKVEMFPAGIRHRITFKVIRGNYNAKYIITVYLSIDTIHTSTITLFFYDEDLLVKYIGIFLIYRCKMTDFFLHEIFRIDITLAIYYPHIGYFSLFY